MTITNKWANVLAAVLISIMAALAFATLKDDTLTYDEVAHIGAGYSYWHNRDYRLNPEHPPLIKDLAGLPLQFLGFNFPEWRYWADAAPHPWWTQFDFGDQFLYHSGNEPDKIMFFARIGPIIVLLLMAGFLFFWGKKLLGGGWALFLLALFVFCPNFMAHGRLVTTDVGASFGVLLATYFWLKFLKNPNWKNIAFAGAAFGLAMLVKFSLILLAPFFAVITAVWALLQPQKIKSLWSYFYKSMAAALIGMLFVIYPVYWWHIAKYPAQKQYDDAKIVLATTSLPQWLQNANLELMKPPLLRPLGQYVLGVNMAANRTGTGNTTYFEGAVSAKGRLDYFPIMYLAKMPLAFHILTLIALGWAMFLLFKNKFWRNFWPRFKKSLIENYDLYSLAVFLAIYWAASLAGSLNIGLRHILPTFAPVYILVIAGLAAATQEIKNGKTKGIFIGTISFLLGWFAASSLLIFPHYLAYYNELAGGPDNGYKIAVDSNLDWGQDLKRLEKWIERYNICASDDRCRLSVSRKSWISDDFAPKDWTIIDKIYLDYFGGGNPAYYLGDKYIKWTSDMDPAQIPVGSYLAVSANQMMGQRAKAINGYDQPTDKYQWLDVYEPPVAKIGYSIFIYKIK